MKYIEKLIARKIIEGLLADGRVITVDFERGYDSQPACGNDVDKILAQMDEVDECWLMIGQDDGTGYDGGWVYLIWGNGNGGWDCLSDYTTNLEAALKLARDFVETEGD